MIPKQALPAGMSPGTVNYGDLYCCWGTWQIAIMPFIEQENAFKIYQNYGGDDSTGPRYAGGVNVQVTQTALCSFNLPYGR